MDWAFCLAPCNFVVNHLQNCERDVDVFSVNLVFRLSVDDVILVEFEVEREKSIVLDFASNFVKICAC